MLFPKITGPVLSRDERHKLAFKGAKAVPFPEFDESSDIWLDDWNALKRHWDGFNGPVRDPNCFTVAVDRGSGQYIAAHYDHGSIEVAYRSEEELNEIKELLPDIAAPRTIKAGKTTQANALCPCGSGRKYKKCCRNKG
jgi:hypothetical protein